MHGRLSGRITGLKTEWQVCWAPSDQTGCERDNADPTPNWQQMKHCCADQGQPYNDPQDAVDSANVP
jgi:hypothetical protein